MVVLSAAICTKSGKSLISRQFVEMTRLRIEGLLAAFPKLIGVENKQHTFVETEAVRYVYQPLESMYLLLVTNKASNIVEDLETLRLLSKAIPNITGSSGSLTEEQILDKCYELIFAFDEVITAGGYREPITLQQIKTNMEMESHEEKLHNMIKVSKMESAKDQAIAAAKAIKDRQKEQQKTGISSASYSHSESQMSSNSASNFSEPSISQPAISSPVNQTSSTRSQPIKGMSLGMGGKSKAFEDALMKEDKLAPVVSSVSKVSEQPVATPMVQQHPLMLSVTEKVSVRQTRDGIIDSVEIKGNLMLTAMNDDVANCVIKLKQGNTSGFSFNTHPKINKALYEKQGVLQLKEAGKGFPSGRPVGILKWTNSDSNDNLVPLKINCWPEEESRGLINVTIDYSMDLDGFELHDVKIRIPLGTTAQPNIINVDGTPRHIPATSELSWEIDLIDKSNSSGNLEFSISQKDSDAFFPIHVEFSSKRLYCPMDIQEVTLANGASQLYGISKGLSTEEYIIG